MANVPNAVEILPKNLNRLSRAHERYRQTDRRQTDGRQQIANVNITVTVSVNNAEYLKQEI